MKIQEAVYTVLIHGDQDSVITRPYLIDERHCVLRLQKSHLPLKLYNTLTKLSIDWVPSIDELNASDWYPASLQHEQS